MSHLKRILQSKKVWLFLFILVLGFWSLPVLSISRPYAKIVMDRDGALLGARIASDEQWRFPPSKDRHHKFETALIRMEDKRFYHHIGVDPIAVLRAIKLNVEHGKVQSGASTLTMQVIRIAQNNPKRTIPEKIWEMMLAFRLEAALSKEDILLMYKHNAPFGGNIVGLEAASWRYFGRPPDQLSWSESAMLAVLPNNPALIHLGRNRKQLKKKRDRLLRMLYADGLFSASDLELYILESIPPKPKALPQKVPHLLFAPKTSWRTHTTIKKDLQQYTDEVISLHASRLSQNQIHNIAAVMIDVPTGEILSYVGNAGKIGDTKHGFHVDIVHSRRSTGSTLKPFLYYAMLESGELLPDELIPDIPINLDGFAPKNYDRLYQGAISASLALARSRNIPAIWMLKKYGVDRWYADLKSWGMTTLHRKPDDYGLSLILGGAEGTLWDLARMYHLLVWSLEHEEEEILPSIHWNEDDNSASDIPRLKRHISWFVTQSLKKVHRPANGRIINPTFENIAWKTGTSYGFRDAWAIGFDPQTVVAVWVGNADGEGRANLTGHKAAAPILFDLLRLRKSERNFTHPTTGIVSRELCPRSGLPRSANCPHGIHNIVPEEAQERTPCSYCTKFYCNQGCTLRMDSRCAQINELQQKKRFQLPPIMEYYYAKTHVGYTKIPPWSTQCTTLDQPLKLVFPRNYAEIFIPIDLNGQRGKVVFEATHRQRDILIHWHLDEHYLGSTTDIHQMSVSPSKGKHEMTIIDENGNKQTHIFSVEDSQ
ncbi:MAG: penicillin-binding protein 1C [Deltaproteobacteria bacterium]|nr:penicillin-binding protein 1C [Deltaproteobacteria bacterium]